MTSPVTARISKKVNFGRHRPFLGGRFDEGRWPTSGFFHLQGFRLVPNLTYSQMGIRKAYERSPIHVRYAGVYVKPSYSYLIPVVYAKYNL